MNNDESNLQENLVTAEDELDDELLEQVAGGARTHLSFRHNIVDDSEGDGYCVSCSDD